MVNKIKNPFKVVFENLKKKGLFGQYQDYDDYCEKTGLKNEYIPPNKEDEEKARLEYLESQKVEAGQDEINVKDLFD